MLRFFQVLTNEIIPIRISIRTKSEYLSIFHGSFVFFFSGGIIKLESKYVYLRANRKENRLFFAIYNLTYDVLFFSLVDKLLAYDDYIEIMDERKYYVYSLARYTYLNHTLIACFYDMTKRRSHASF